MFHQLFEHPYALTRHQTGPLVEERLRYLDHLAKQGAAQKTLRGTAAFLFVVADYLRLADRPGEVLTTAEIQEKAILWADRPPKPAQGNQRISSRGRFLRHATHWLQFLGRLQQSVPPSCPYAELISDFAEHLRRDRELSPLTIDYRCWAIRDFLRQLGTPPQALREIAITQIDVALMEKVTRCAFARVSVQTYANALRSFFRYAEARGWCRAGLAGAIRAPRVFPQESLPAGPSWEQVRHLIAASEGDRPTAIRDRALLMLLAIYGLRAGEVVRLRLEDFDWERELLAVSRPKTQVAQTYPLCRPVGDAVLRYLHKVRPRSVYREVFLTLRAPVQPLHRSALTSLVSRRLHVLGVTLPHYGPHSLRHACATHLLEQGLSLKAIGDHLGHQHPDSTRIYAKVDLAGLRQVADLDLGGLS
ncbi:MAG: tyrosine-type recombinase/integrase [Terriglobia bacterium]|jgi:integrase/recombinase XerD